MFSSGTETAVDRISIKGENWNYVVVLRKRFHVTETNVTGVVNPSGAGPTPLYVSKAVGKAKNISVTGLPFIYGTANNNRVFYGSQSPYILSSSAGNSLSAKAEEIYDGNSTCPTVKVIADPRRTGKPYFRFNPLNGYSADGTGKYTDFFRNAIAGKEWRSIPMVFTQKSGGLLDRTSFNASQKLRSMDETHTTQNLENAKAVDTINAIMAGIGVFGKINGGDKASGIAGGLQTAVSMGENEFLRNTAYSQYMERSNLQRAIEEQQFMISQNFNAPTVSFSADPDLFSEATNNGFIVSRVVYKQADISRIDKILTAFGYKFTKVLEASDFTNRTYFNYVRASISVGNLPQWWANGISAQLGGGVRIWHVKPNHSYYSSNPVRT